MNQAFSPSRDCVAQVLTGEKAARCTQPARPLGDFCEACDAQATEQGDADSLRCPWCGEYGDFTHLNDSTVAALRGPAGPPGAEVACGQCGQKSLVLEAVLQLKVQRVLLPDETARTAG